MDPMQPGPDDLSTAEAVRAVYPLPPNSIAARKHLDHLDPHCRTFLALSPFAVLASSNAAGDPDASPRGGPPGWLVVLDRHHLLIPDAPGNRRVDTLLNLAENPRLGLCCFVPGYGEVLRLSGRARITRDAALRERATLGGKAPISVIVFRVEDAFLHCAKAVRRSHLWDPAGWPDIAGLPAAARIWHDHTHAAFDSVAAIQALVDDSYANRVY